MDDTHAAGKEKAGPAASALKAKAGPQNDNTRRLIKRIERMISRRTQVASMNESLNDIIKNDLGDENKSFLKIDIEGSEYDILEDIILNKNKIQGIVIEFHEVLKNLQKIVDFTKNLNTDLYLVHIHINNYSMKEFDKFPNAIELTYSKKNLHLADRPNNKEYPIKNLDYPNSKRSPDIKILFKE